MERKKKLAKLQVKRVCGNCQLTLSRPIGLICIPMDNGVFLKDGHHGWFAPVVDADEEACSSRFTPK